MTTTAPQPTTPLASDLCWLLSRASHALTTELTAALDGTGLSPRGHAVLSAASDGEHTQTELARIVGLDKTTMVVTLDELEQAGLAERRPSASDRRVRVIEVTKFGRRKVEEADAIFDRVKADVLAALEPEDRDAFLRSLSTLACGRLSEPVKCAQPVRRPRR